MVESKWILEHSQSDILKTSMFHTKRFELNPTCNIYIAKQWFFKVSKLNNFNLITAVLGLMSFTSFTRTSINILKIISKINMYFCELMIALSKNYLKEYNTLKSTDTYLISNEQ